MGIPRQEGGYTGKYAIDGSESSAKPGERAGQSLTTGLTGWPRAAGGFAPAGYAGAPTAPSADQQLAMLKSQAEFVENQLAEIRKRIDELGNP